MNIDVISDWQAVEKLRADWNALLDRNPSLSIFSSPEWLSPWWEAYGAGELHFLVCREGTEIQGLVPMYAVDAAGPFGRQRLLRLVGDGSGDSDNLEPICLPGHEAAVCNAVMTHASKQDALVMFNTMPESSAYAALRRAVENSGWIFTDSLRPRTVIPLPASWEEHMERLTTKLRTKTRSSFKRIETKYAQHEFRRASQHDLAQSLQELYNLHQKRWAGRSAGSFSSERRKRFYGRMAKNFLDRGWLHLWSLQLEDKVVAAQFAFHYRDTAYSLQEGFDPDFAADSVGFVLRSHVLRYLIEQGVTYYDFLGGENDSKMRWAGKLHFYHDLHFAPAVSRAAAYVFLRRCARKAKRWVKKASPQLVARAKRLTGLRPPAIDFEESAATDAPLTITLPLWSD